MRSRGLTLATAAAITIAACGPAQPTPSPTPFEIPPSQPAASSDAYASPTDLSADAALAMVDRYQRALEASDAQAAWALLAPAFRASALDSDLDRFAAERAASIERAGPAYNLVLRSAELDVLRHWASPRLTADADLAGGYLIEVHYPSLAAWYRQADPACASDFYLVAPSTTAAAWYLWWVGDTAALANGSCDRLSTEFFTPPPRPSAPITTEADAVLAAEADASITGPFVVQGAIEGRYVDLWQGPTNDPSGLGASLRATLADKVVWRVQLTGPYGAQDLYIEATTGVLIDYMVQGR